MKERVIVDGKVRFMLRKEVDELVEKGLAVWCKERDGDYTRHYVKIKGKEEKGQPPKKKFD